MRITQARNPILLESCDSTGLHPTGYYAPPSRFVEADTEGRLIEVLREGARRARGDPQQALVRAVLAWLDGDQALANALADLTVTGRMAVGLFRALAPNDADLSAEVIREVGRVIDYTLLTPAVRGVLNRAYEVYWTIMYRGITRRLGWITTWAEVDSPHRPVNVPGTQQNQYEITVCVQATELTPQHNIKTRYAIFNEANISPDINLDEVIRLRQLPPEPRPIITNEERFLIYIHGHSSRLEEGEKLGEVFHGHPFTLISMDLPCNGFAEMLDHITLASESDTDTLEAFPLLSFIEQYVVDFVTAVGDQAGRAIHNQIAAMIGGSLGGNTSLRLAGRDMNEAPWMNNFIAWSAASVWTPYEDIIRETGPNTARARMKERDFPERRKQYIEQVFDDSFRVFGVKPQGDYWYRDDGWEPCKTLYLRGSREDRREIYNENFRRWHWRVALEQMLFSHREPVSRLEKLRGRLLFMAAEGDDYPWTHIHDSSRDMAMLAINTPGYLRRLQNTGHSIHDERPHQLAIEIRQFLPFPQPIDNDSDTDWMGWLSLGGNLVSDPVAIINEDGRIDVFVRNSNNRIFHSKQLTINGVWRRELIELNAGLDHDDTFGTFAVERNWDGRLEIFSYFAKHGWVAHAWQNKPNGRWHNWDKGSHIKQLIGDAADGVFAVERFGESPGDLNSEDGLRFDVGRRWLLVGSRRNNGRIQIRGQNSFGWWTQGRDLGQSSLHFIGTPVATRLSNGLLIIFARSEDNKLWLIQEEAPDNWQSEWQEFSATAVDSDVSVALDANGRLTVTTRAPDGQLMLRRELFANGEWGSWEAMHADLAVSSRPQLIRNPWGELQLFVRWSDGSIRTRRQSLSLVREWTAWGNLGGNAQFGPTVALQANGMPIIFYVGVDRELYFSFINHSTYREVTAIRKLEGEITHLCNETAEWSPIEVATVIDEITHLQREYTLRTPEGERNNIIVRQILTTRPDDSIDNNMSNLPVLNPAEVSNPVPPSDLFERHVTHVLKYRGDSVFSIRGLCNQEENWSVDRLEAFHQIQERSHHYYIEDSEGHRNNIIARQFLTTLADGVEENNLESLPECM